MKEEFIQNFKTAIDAEDLEITAETKSEYHLIND